MSNNNQPSTQPRLIALCGFKGVGKSTYAKFLAGENGLVLSFATPIKHMLKALVGHEYVFGEYQPIIIDDLRFENEAQMVRDLGGEIWEIDRKNFTPANDNHISEAGVTDVDRKVLI